MPTARLNDRAVVRIAGADAGTLLQNVVTNDIPDVDRHGSGYGALLTPQGKILWDFVLHKAADGYAADVRKDHAEAFAKRLGLYKLRAKVEIVVALDLAVFVEWLKDSSPNPSPQGGGERPLDSRLAALGARWIAANESVDTDASVDDWHAHRIALSIPEGGVDFVFGDAFPHDAAMDSLKGVAFEKGCYIGQEVVSRMRHRDTARRRIVALATNAPLPAPGADILAGGRPVGRLGSSENGHAIGLVRLDRVRAALDAGQEIRVGDVPLTVSLPAWATYDWPAVATTGED